MKTHSKYTELLLSSESKLFSSTKKLLPMIRRWYLFFVIQVFHSLCLLLLLFFFAHLFVRERTFNRFHPSIGRQYSDTINPDAYYFTSPSETEKILETYDRYASAGHWQAHPANGLINREFHSQYLNVDSQGFRNTSQSSTSSLLQRPLIVWVLGGSSTFGWGLSDQHTLPSQLQQKLQIMFSSRRVEVINMGVPYSNTDQETHLFLSQLQTQKQKPDLVFFVDGANEMIHIALDTRIPLFTELSKAWENWIQPLAHPQPLRWVESTPESPWIRLQSIVAPSTQRNDIVAFPSEEEKLVNYQKTKENYYLNYEVNSRICEYLEISCFFIIQPLLGPEKSGPTSDPYYQQFRKDVLSLKQKNVLDLTQSLSTEAKEYFAVIDNLFHYSDRGTEAFSQQLLKHPVVHSALQKLIHQK